MANVLWFLLAGWWLALSHLVTGALLCLTIIGIPLGVADIKMAGAALVPFGKEIVSTAQLGQPPLGGEPDVVADPELVVARIGQLLDEPPVLVPNTIGRLG